jgi:hypothetical protein
MTYKKENDIWTDMIALLNEALTAKNIVGMTVMRSFQPTDVTGKNFVLINKISSRRYGWRGRHDKKINNVMTHIEKYFQEMRFQINVIKKINLNDISEITAADIANMIIDYLLSDKGLASLRSKGYMPLRVLDVRNPTFVNETDNFQFNPNFDLICTIQQEIVDNQKIVDAYDFTLKGV